MGPATNREGTPKPSTTPAVPSIYRGVAEGRAVACTRCGTWVEPALVSISPQGRLVCAGCLAVERSEFGKQPAGGVALVAGFASFGLGTVPATALAMTPRGTSPYETLFFAMGLAAVTLGFLALTSLLRVQNWRTGIRLLPWTLAAAIPGLALGIFAMMVTKPSAGGVALGLLVVSQSAARCSKRRSAGP